MLPWLESKILSTLLYILAKLQPRSSERSELQHVTKITNTHGVAAVYGILFYYGNALTETLQVTTKSDKRDVIFYMNVTSLASVE